MTMIIDGGCFAGHDLQTGYSYPIEKLLSDFDRYGVAQGVVASYRSIYQDLREGNVEVAAWARRFPDRIIPLGILHTSYYGQTPEMLIGWLKRELKFRAVGLFSSPAYYPVEWKSPVCREIGESAARWDMALQAGISNEQELSEVVSAWGDLPVPIMIRWMAGHRYKLLASEFAVAKRCKQLLFDIGNMSSTGALEQVSNAVGADRFFFATNSPHNMPYCPHVALHTSKLTARQRDAISHNTIRRALRLEGPLPTTSLDTLYETEAWRQLCQRPKVDVHWHPDHWNLGEPALQELDQIDTFNQFGYERVIFSSILALNYDLEAGNRLTAAWFAKDDRISGLVVINPLRPEESLSLLEEYGDHPRFVGIKTIQDVFGLGLDDRLYEPFLKRAAEKNLPILAHLPGLENAARRFPEVTFIAAHANWGRAQKLVDVPNVHFDFSTGHALRHETQLGRFIQSVGAHRVLFGSDGQLVSPAWSLSKLMHASLTPEQQTAILSANAYRIFPKLRRNGWNGWNGRTSS